jgi:hypothetical protein
MRTTQLRTGVTQNVGTAYRFPAVLATRDRANLQRNEPPGALAWVFGNA